MDLRPPLGSLLVFLGLYGICAGLDLENCTDYSLQFGRVFSVPGDVAMLNSTLVAFDVFNFTSVPYNVSWYDSKTEREITNQSGRILVRGETLWFLNVKLDDDGEYVTIVRTPHRCYRQDTRLVVGLPVPGDCGRPWKSGQSLTKGVTDYLKCPLKDYISTLDSYNIPSSITWYRGCETIVDRTGRHTYMDKSKLKIDGVESENNANYTCTLTFSLGGVTGSVSETIQAWVSGKYSLTPQVHEPSNEVLRAPPGSNFSKRCLVFVPCVGRPSVDIVWLVRGKFILNTEPSDRIHTTEQRLWKDGLSKGVWLERLLVFVQLTEEDFHLNYTCRADSGRGHPEGYFSLTPPDPDTVLPVSSLFAAVTLLFVVSVTVYHLFKVDMVLCFRGAFPVLYANTDLDGKLYDAYVAYPPPGAGRFSEEVEEFALRTLPHVLETSCGYKLFIAGRDCRPGQAVVDSVEDNLAASRRLLLLYTASTFVNNKHTSSTNNNNIVYTSGEDDGQQQLENVAGMHRALLEGSLKVVLVELEQISAAQLALFPESVRHLRKKQGAVRCWRKPSAGQRWRTCGRTRRTEEDEEKGGRDGQLSPSSRFWKEIRYRMPVRGKRTVHAEKSALFNVR